MPSSSEDNWPLVASQEVKALDSNFQALVDLIDPDNGLLDELLCADCIDVRQMERIEAADTEFIRNRRLLDVLRRRSVRDFNEFVECLLKTKQVSAASLLSPNVAESAKPLSDAHRQKLIRNYPALVELIHTEDGLLTELLAADCITWRQKEFIESGPSQSAINKRLLDVVRRGTESDFNNFVRCLTNVGQKHICRLLTESVQPFGEKLLLY
jgi:hypothetical protein